jgi:hypothetical protein
MQRGGYHRAARGGGSGGHGGPEAELHLYIPAGRGGGAVGGVGGLTTWLGGGDREKESLVAAGESKNGELAAGGSLALVRRLARSPEFGRWNRDSCVGTRRNTRHRRRPFLFFLVESPRRARNGLNQLDHGSVLVGWLAHMLH